MTTTRIRKQLSLVALTAVAAVGGLAVAASAATVGPAEVFGPGTHIPINFAAFKEPANKKLPANYRIIRKHVELVRGEPSVATVMTAPKGFGAVTIGFGDGHEVGGVVKDVNYSGKRSVRVKLFTSNEVDKGETGKGTLYLLARRA